MSIFECMRIPAPAMRMAPAPSNPTMTTLLPKEARIEPFLHIKSRMPIMRRLNKGYNPDYILCSGEMSYKKFISSNFLQPNRILLFGSNRAFIENSSILNKKRNNTFLVLPEGDLLECLPLVDFTILLSKSLRNLNFIIRTHPITDRKKLLKLRPILKESRKNI